MKQESYDERPGYAAYVTLGIATLVLSFWSLG